MDELKNNIDIKSQVNNHLWLGLDFTYETWKAEVRCNNDLKGFFFKLILTQSDGACYYSFENKLVKFSYISNDENYV